jgi:hypothetical protein
MLLNKLILLLARIKLRVRKYEKFQFTNQRSERDYYFFNSSAFWKVEFDEEGKPSTELSHVSLNWLLDPDCKIRKIFN